MGHVRTFQAGPQGADSQRLLNEIAAARVVLLDAAKKRAYDEQLRCRAPLPPSPQPMVVAVPASVTPAAPAPSEVAPATGGAIRVQPREPSAVARRPSKDMTVEIAKIVGGGIAGIVLATVLLRLGFGIDMTGLFPVTTPEPPPGVGAAAKEGRSEKVAGGRRFRCGQRKRKARRAGSRGNGGVRRANSQWCGEEKEEAEAQKEAAAIQRSADHRSDASTSRFRVAAQRSARRIARQATGRGGKLASHISQPDAKSPATSPGCRAAGGRAAARSGVSAVQAGGSSRKAVESPPSCWLWGEIGRPNRPERWTLLKAAAELAADGGDAHTVAQAMNVLSQTFDF